MSVCSLFFILCVFGPELLRAWYLLQFHIMMGNITLQVTF